ncbi:MAG: hypothetical protein Q4C96_07550 [Planctomycetia bacterium]|nr:hypothetical protein [Planctomycetia bacterium]
MSKNVPFLDEILNAAEHEEKVRRDILVKPSDTEGKKTVLEILVNPLDDLEVQENPFPLYFGFLASFALHVVIFLVLAFWSKPEEGQGGTGLVFEMTFGEAMTDQLSEEDGISTTIFLTEDLDKQTKADTPLTHIEVSEKNETKVEIILPEDPTVKEEKEQKKAVEESDSEVSEDNPSKTKSEAGSSSAHSSDENGGGSAKMGENATFPRSGTLEGRTDPEIRERMMQDPATGPTRSSEEAVLRGLRWLEAHQQIDSERPGWGGWTFHLENCASCRGKCRNPGEEYSTTGATALALLAMLGHGNTREQGEFSQSVSKGLYYLSTKARKRKGIPGYDLREGTMYAHCMATLAICEALIMEKQKKAENPLSTEQENTTKDDLEILARGAVEWLVWAQDPRTGGWRYEPKTPGDVTLTVWAIMALKSARMAGFEIHSSTISGMERFLSSVQSEDGSQFSYRPDEEPIRSTTAIGLTGKIFLGAPRNAPFLQEGISHLGNWRFSATDLYYNYYATLTLRHYGGETWRRWNPGMRDFLVATQSFSGHENGSWYFDEPDKTHNRHGGRLYTTCMAIMILEVYYRYMPIYQ